MNQSQDELLLEEYKILEGRYRSDTGRIWSQAQILIAANIVAITLVSTVFSDITTRTWLIRPGYAVTGIAVVGLLVSFAWFVSLATDIAYQEISRDLLCNMELRLPLPIKVFYEAKQRRQQFIWWRRIGGETALHCLSVVFAVMWLVVFLIGRGL